MQLSSRQRRWLWIFTGVLFTLVLLALLIDPLWRATHEAPLGHTVSKVRATLDRDLPAGTSLDSVSVYLDALTIEHSPFDSSARGMLAIQRDVEFDPIFSRHIQIGFLFDSAHRLESSSVKLRLVGM
jgi:hypothetical protein